MTDIANQGGAPAQATVDIRAAAAAADPAAAAASTAVPVTPDANQPDPAAAAAAAAKAAPANPAAVTLDGDGDRGNPPLDADQTEGGVIEYAPTGDPGMDMALSFVGKLGFDPNHPAMLKAGEGDFSFIKAALAGLGAKATGWEQYVALAERSYEGAVEKANATATEVRNAIYTTAGGEEQWGQIAAWAKDVATPEQKASINRMLASDPTEARAAVMMLKAQYEAASGTTIEPANPLRASTPGAGSDTNSVQPLSPKEYASEVDKLMRTKGPHAVNANSPEYRALQQRALAYRG
ncbi:scaffold-like protein [Brevundimonas phage AA]|uniref:Scaffold-like protein n=1 Tax=Brevundimonas phage AA TaxID=2880937 RepID=A0AAN0KL80_9CAUD|nr:scaffold-like protein [Brevundimonas phage BC]UCR90886.1 scaffold-like protein [Brevundimonas phage AA]